MVLPAFALLLVMLVLPEAAEAQKRRETAPAQTQARTFRDCPNCPEMAVVPAGYADGLDTRMSGRGHVLIRGKRVPIIGAVSMDMITVDVSDIRVETGDEVVIIGEQGGERLEVREIAAAIGTNPYEMLCRVGTRIERIYQ